MHSQTSVHMVKTASSYAEGGQFDSRLGHYFYFSCSCSCLRQTACNRLLSRLFVSGVASKVARASERCDVAALPVISCNGSKV